MIELMNATEVQCYWQGKIGVLAEKPVPMPLKHELSGIKAGLLQWEAVNWPPQLCHENQPTGSKVKI